MMFNLTEFINTIIQELNDCRSVLNIGYVVVNVNVNTRMFKKGLLKNNINDFNYSSLASSTFAI